MLRRFLRYVDRVFDFRASLQTLRDSRHHPLISCQTIFYCVFLLFVLRLGSLNALEAYYQQRPRRRRWQAHLGQVPPSADTVGYSLMRFDCGRLREMIRGVYQRLQRNHLLGQIRLSGWSIVALDGHELFSSYSRCCSQCSTRRVHTLQGEKIQYYHRIVMAQLLGGHLAIPLDIEPIRSGEDEVAAGRRLMERLLKRYPKAFDVLAVDGLYGRAGFVNLLTRHSKHILFVLKENNPDLLEDAKGLFTSQVPCVREQDSRLYRRWDEEGFEPWPEVKGPLRVVRSLETHCKGKQLETSDWYWCTTLPKAIVSTETICQIGHKRWEIENQGLNVLVNYYGLDHCFKHHPTAIVAFALICCLAYTLFQMFYWRNLKLPLPRRGSMQFVTYTLLESLPEILQHPIHLKPD
ncbi:MAG: transposase [bacterium]